MKFNEKSLVLFALQILTCIKSLREKRILLIYLKAYYHFYIVKFKI